jgi:tetratricopeptide (TPR) repeat protein
LLEGFDMAEALCRQGLECEFDTADLADFDEFQKEQTLLREMLEMVGRTRRRHAAEKYIDKARPHVEAGRYQPALLLLDKAIEVAPDAAHAWFLRCQCHLSLDHPQEARRDLDKFRSLVTAEESSDGITAADHLEEEVRAKEQLVADFSIEGLRLRREVAECLRREDFEQAARLLQQAAQCAAAAGRQVVHEELSVVLTRWAIAEVNAMMKDKSSSPDSDAMVCCRAIERLEEAIRLDPTNHQARSNLETVRTIAKKLKSTMLTSQAVDMVNSAQTGGGGDPMKLMQVLSALREAKKLLTEAIALDPDNSRARDNLRTVERMLQQFGQH